MPISAYIRNLRAKIGKELLLIPGVAAVVRNAAGEVLVQHRSDDGNWSLPAGAVDPGEEPARAIVREVWEETGLQVVPERIIGVYGGRVVRTTYPNGDQVEATTTVFECRIVGGELGARDGESQELRFVPEAELPQLIRHYPPEFFATLGETGPARFQWSAEWLNELEP